MTEKDPMIGRVVLGRYRIVRPLAKGGMGVVYLARTEGASGFSKPFVVKRMATDILVDANMLKLFVREARVMSRLRHPGLVGVTDFGEEGGDYLMVLEYVHGYHLGQWHRYHRQTLGPFPIDLILHICCKVLDGLDYAHKLTDSSGRALEIVHRDVSPSNILLDVEGIVKLADFGVARSEEHTEKTEETTIKGKMPYLAPELFRLAKPTPATDAYAAAVVLHEIIVGRNEFRTGDMASTVSRVLEHEPTRIDEIRPDAPDGLADLLEQALHKDPEVRFDSAADLASALRAVRPAAEEDADRQLREFTQRDFLDPRMGELLGVVSLAERDAAWRNAPITEPPSSEPESSPPTTIERTDGGSLARRAGSHRARDQRDSGPGVAVEVFYDEPDEGPAGSPAAQPAPARSWPVVVGMLLFGLVAAGVTYAVVGLNQNPSQTQFVQVTPYSDPSTNPNSQKNPATDPPAAATSDAGETPPTDAGSASTPPSKGTNRKNPAVGTPSRSSAEALSAAVGARRGALIACFQGQTNARVDLSIRFSVAPSGQVTQASIAGSSSANIAQTPAGRCVLRVARATRFPRQPRPLTFSIPFTVQATQR